MKTYVLGGIDIGQCSKTTIIIMGVATGVAPGVSTDVAMGAATGVWQTGGNLIANDRPGIRQHIHKTGGSRNPSKKFSIF